MQGPRWADLEVGVYPGERCDLFPPPETHGRTVYTWRRLGLSKKLIDNFIDYRVVSVLSFAGSIILKTLEITIIEIGRKSVCTSYLLDKFNRDQMILFLLSIDSSKLISRIWAFPDHAIFRERV